jgi:hypothetical protein
MNSAGTGTFMPHALTELNLNAVTKPPGDTVHEICADVRVVGAGIAGSTAIESARLGHSIVLADSLPLIGRADGPFADRPLLRDFRQRALVRAADARGIRRHLPRTRPGG